MSKYAPNYYSSSALRYRPGRLDHHESGINGYALKRTSTDIGFLFFYFDLEYLRSSKFKYKKASNLLLLRHMVCIESFLLALFWFGLRVFLQIFF
jgi:hypothetical protein